MELLFLIVSFICFISAFIAYLSENKYLNKILIKISNKIFGE